jgi:hypothetical protein
VTRLALRVLNRQELQALVAYGMSQILNGDTALVTRTAAYRQALRWPAELANTLITLPVRSARVTDGEIFLWLGLLLWVGLLLAALTLPTRWAAEWLQRRVGNERQLLADATAMQFTRNPEAYIGALIQGTALTGPEVRLKPAVAYFSQLSFVSLPGFRSAEHVPVVTRIRAVDAGISAQEVSRRQREAIERFTLAEAREEPVSETDAPPVRDPWQRMRAAMMVLEAGQSIDPTLALLCLLIDRESPGRRRTRN